uniref:Kinetochore protein NDC80 n=1 Tax=Hyaloperonospora arabidopsidis (strain Emoy2) TaxID=559515 RepID=M4B8Z7_HYAAE
MRRTTLGTVSSSQLNARSTALRHPSARVSVPSKSTSSSVERQSIGVVPRRRVSTAAGLTTTRRPPPGPRASITSRQSTTNPNDVTSRRSSTYSSRASLSGRSGARVLDPRPIGDRAYLHRCVRTLVEFLSEHPYDQSLPAGLAKRGPSKKEFFNILRFLFKQVDPTFEFGVKVEEDVVVQFRNLRYPFPISKTSLAAVGTPHTWPTLLLSITWLIELLTYDEAIQEANETEESDDENGDKSFFKYLDVAYRVFLAGEDDKCAEVEQQEKDKLSTKLCETRELEMDCDELKKRIEQARADKNALSELRKKKADCLSDLVKFKDLVNQFEMLNTKLDKKMEALAKVQESLEEELHARRQDIQKLQIRIENQELSAHDIEQIAQERARLTDQLHHHLAQQEEIQIQIKKDENRAAAIRDRLDHHIHEYMNTCRRLKIIPSTAKNALNFDYSLELDPTLEELDAVQKLSHHLKTNVRQAALRVKQHRNTRANEGLDLAIVLTEELAQSENKLNIEMQSEKRTEAEVRKIADQMVREREKRTESLSRKQATTEEVEIKITNISNEDNLVQEEVISSEQHLQDVKKASVEMRESYQALLDKNRHAVTNVLIACTNHKDMVDRAISSLEAELSRI